MSLKRTIIALVLLAPILALNIYMGLFIEGEQRFIRSMAWLFFSLGIAFLALVAYRSYAISHDRNKDIPTTNENWRLPLSLRRILSAVVAFFFPESGGCYRCHMPWPVTTAHRTPVPGLNGYEHSYIFAMCKSCWNDTERSPRKRLRYYGHMFADWVVQGMDRGGWQIICEAVAAESGIDPEPECCTLPTPHEHDHHDAA